jgi:hypothetical protein
VTSTRLALVALLAIAACTSPDWQLPAAATDQGREVPVLEIRNGQPIWSSDLAIWTSDCFHDCLDEDRDGLQDVWEQALLQSVRPILWMHHDDGLFRDRRAALAMIGRVWATATTIHVIIVIAYTKDYGRCGSDSHPGDSERIVIQLAALADRHSVRADRWYTAAHEGTSYDASLFGTFASMHGAHVRWQSDSPVDALYVSRDKHATYPTATTCAGHSVPCLDDICAADVPIDVTPWNAGEPSAPLLLDLSAHGFPEQCTWCNTPFCGDGSGRANCAGSVRDKLTHDPFSDAR